MRTCRAASVLCAAGTRFSCIHEPLPASHGTGREARPRAAHWRREQRQRREGPRIPPPATGKGRAAGKRQPRNAGGGAGVGRAYSMSLFASVLCSRNSWPAIRRMSACMSGALVRATRRHSRYRLSTCGCVGSATSVRLRAGGRRGTKYSVPPHPPARAKVAPDTGRHCLCDITLHVHVQARQHAARARTCFCSPECGRAAAILEFVLFGCVHERGLPRTQCDLWSRLLFGARPWRGFGGKRGGGWRRRGRWRRRRRCWLRS